MYLLFKLEKICVDTVRCTVPRTAIAIATTHTTTQTTVTKAAIHM